MIKPYIVFAIVLGFMLSLVSTSYAETSPREPKTEVEQTAEAPDDQTPKPAVDDLEKTRLEIEKAKLEAEKAKAEAERAKAEAEKARLEAEGAKSKQEELKKEQEKKSAELSEEFHRHVNFFLRLQLGFGFGAWLPTPSNDDLLHLSPTTMFNIALGGCPIENLVLLADIWGSMSMIEKESGLSSLRAMTTVVAFGVNYYFMPQNLYVGGSIGYATTTVTGESQGVSYDTERLNGFGLSGHVGKEWWVSDNWGLGLAFRINYAWTKDGDQKVNFVQPVLLFSATYN